MAARSAWAGAFMFAGYPIPVTMYTVVTSRKSSSFKMLDPIHKMPVSQKLVDCEGADVERAATLKGIEVAKGTYVALTPEAQELIEKATMSAAVEIERFAALSSVPVDLALESYRIVPNPKVPGAEQPVQILWNGLRATERAAIIPDWCPRAGSRPSTLIVRAVADGLAGNVLPFYSELKSDVPAFAPAVEPRMEQAFIGVMTRDYVTENFDHALYADGYAQRRQAAIELVLSGEPIPAAVKETVAPASAPDLMSMLEASLSGAGAPPKKAANRAAEAVSA